MLRHGYTPTEPAGGPPPGDPLLAQYPQDEAITFRIRNARIIAGMVLDWLDSDPSVEYRGTNYEMRLNARNDTDGIWKRLSPTATGPSVEAIIAVFLEWCQEE